jgi:hypothetical protein
LARHSCGLGEKFIDKVEFYSSSQICDIIGYVEEGLLTGKYFEKSKKIRNLLKIHHSQLGQSYSIIKNVQNYWFDRNGNKKRDIDKFLSDIPSRLSTMLNKMHDKALGEKSKDNELTGEWIMYASHNDCNYYLCLATHEEGKGDGKLIYDRIRSCFDEFPELSNFK